MKICHVLRQSSTGQDLRLGIFFNSSTIIDVNVCWELYYEKQGIYQARSKALSHNPPSLAQTLKISENPIDLMKKTVDIFTDLSRVGDLSTSRGGYIAFDLQDDKSAKLTKPIDDIHCYRDFYTHEKHVKKGFEKRAEPMPAAWYDIPVHYKGSPAGFIGPDDMIMWPSFTKKLDYELELAAIIGRPMKNTKKAKDAYEGIFGFTILNDISARDIQKTEMSVRLGPAKGKDFCSVIGPVITTMDEFAMSDPDLLMQARVNGQLWSEGRSSESQFSWAEMIEFVTRDEWLIPSDLLGSGTVGTGCGLELDQWIAPGDIIELEIENIGVLKNIVGTPEINKNE